MSELTLFNLNDSQEFIEELKPEESKSILGGMKWDREKYKDSDLVLNCRHKDDEGQVVCTRGGKVDKEETSKRRYNGEQCEKPDRN